MKGPLVVQYPHGPTYTAHLAASSKSHDIPVHIKHLGLYVCANIWVQCARVIFMVTVPEKPCVLGM